MAAADAAEPPPMHPAQEELSRLLGGKHAYSQGFLEDVQAFVHAIDWAKDQWIFGLIAVEVLIYVLVLANRNHWQRLAGLFAMNAAVLCGLERLNNLARTHWKEFSSQQYFDERGGFICAIFGAPMVICQLVIVILLLRDACSMVIKVKRMELSKDIKAKNAAEKKSE